MKILANDGISKEGIDALENAGHEVITEKVEQDKLVEAINENNYGALLVRSATTVRKDLIDACPNLKFVGRGGVGMDNIDVEYARSKGIVVSNTPAASSQSVAELVMGHLFSISRSLHDSFKNMPATGDADFKVLKKKYGKGVELRGKTIGIIGFGRIGQALASYALGCGMKIIALGKTAESISVELNIDGVGRIESEVKTITDMDALLSASDFISLHVPKQANGSAVLGKDEFVKMKDGVRIVNAARGGVIDEDALLEALNSGKVANVALDVFENEPNPRKDLLVHNNIASTPHIGAATVEAQARIGVELADIIVSNFGSK